MQEECTRQVAAALETMQAQQPQGLEERLEGVEQMRGAGTDQHQVRCGRFFHALWGYFLFRL